ncbi:MAG TPA: GAF domain-containing protein, partial [Acidobacteriota bacterium]|nr:GAF domain-containing protein [Acidobacteriota bacterium]
MQKNKPESQPSAVEERQHQDAFLPGLMEELLEATSENDLIETALSILDRECQPVVSLIGVLPPGNETGFQISIKSHLAEPDTAKLWEVVQKLFDSGIRSSSEDIFRSFSFLAEASILAEESTAASAIRIKALVFGAADLESGHVSLRRLVRLIELKLGELRLSTGMKRASAYLSRLHDSAEAISKNLLNGDQIMQTISEEARKILAVEGAAILMSSDETKTSYTVKARSGFPEATLPVSTALFIRAMETSIDAPRKAIVHRGSDDHTSLMVPLIQAGSIEGALFLHSTDPAFEITEDLSRIAEIYGDWASIAIENAVMFSRVASSQREWENTFDSIADPIYIIDTDYRLRKMNRPLAALAMKSIKLPVNRNCYRYLFHR